MLFFRALSALPLTILYLLADLLYFVTYYVVGYRRKVVRKNLRICFPDLIKEELSEIEKKFYKNLADYIVELIKGLTISKEELLGHVKFEDVAFWQKLKEDNKIVIGLGNHFFNLEWMLLAANALGIFPVHPVYKVINNKFFDSLMKKTRGRFGATPVSKEQALRFLIKNKDQSFLLALAADQRPMEKTAKLWVKLFDRETAFYRGIEAMPTKGNFSVVYVWIEKISRGQYIVKNHFFKTDPKQQKESGLILKEFTALTEANIRKDPANWLWSHNRWKYERSEGEDLIL